MSDNSIDISANLDIIRSTLPPYVALVAVSKFHPSEMIREAYAAGQRLFGESRVQELVLKKDELADLDDIKWHFIGHIQTNKLKQLMACRVDLIQSVDSVRLLEMIDDIAFKSGYVQKVLLQLHVAREETKFGFLPEEMTAYFEQRGYESLKATHICGVMGMATNTDDTDIVDGDFKAIRNVFNQIKTISPDLRGFDTVSMGMTDDYLRAVALGSDMVRIGSAIFGQRNY